LPKPKFFSNEYKDKSIFRKLPESNFFSSEYDALQILTIISLIYGQHSKLSGILTSNRTKIQSQLILNSNSKPRNNQKRAQQARGPQPLETDPYKSYLGVLKQNKKKMMLSDFRP